MTIHLLIEILIFIILGLVVYTYVVYPILLGICSKLFGKRVKSSFDFQPSITILIPCYNEENDIEDLINSVYLSNYPNAKLKILVGSDGSDDRTFEIVTNLTKKYSNLFCYQFERSGKNLTLNKLIELADTEIIFNIDADLRLSEGALQTMVSQFADPQVGSVVASVHFTFMEDDNTGRTGENFYQRYEKYIRTKESSIRGTVNGLGAFGFRKSVMPSIPNNLICDDMWVLLTSMIQSLRNVYVVDAVAFDVRKKTLKQELTRRIRFVSCGISTVLYAKKLLLPTSGWGAFFLLSHKVLRYFSPILLILILLCSVVLTELSVLKYPLIITQIIFYFSALLGWLFEKKEIKFAPFRFALFFVAMNIGFLLGIIRFLRGQQNAVWTRPNK